MRPGRRIPTLADVLLAAALTLVLGWPVFQVWIIGASGPAAGLTASLAELNAPPTRVLALNTLKLVAVAWLTALPLGGLLALLLARTNVPGRSAAITGLVVAAFIPLPLYALGWLGGFGNMGRQQALGSFPWLTGLVGAGLVHGLAALPWVVLVVGVGLRQVEPELEEVVRVYRSPAGVVWLVTLPRAVRAVAAAALLVAALAASDMTVTDLAVVRTYAEEAYLLSQMENDAARLIVRATLPQLIVLAAGTAWLARWVGSLDLRRLAGVGRPMWRIELGRARLAAALGLAGCMAVVLGLPAYAMLWRAGRLGGRPWSARGLGGSLEGAWVDLVGGAGEGIRAPLPGSVLWASLGATLAVGLGWSLAWHARGSRLWRGVALGVFTLLLAIPGPIVGLMIKQAYGSWPGVNRSPWLLVLSTVARSLPYALALTVPLLWSWPRGWDEEARMAGLGPWTQALRLGLPLTAAGLGVAWLFVFVQALGELPAAIMTYAPGYELVSLLLWSQMHMGVESRLAALGVILVALLAVPAVLALLIATLRQSHRLGPVERGSG